MRGENANRVRSPKPWAKALVAAYLAEEGFLREG
jgi:hypothetical protein